MIDYFVKVGEEMLCCNYKGTYIGKSMCGFQTDHLYTFELSNNGRTYELLTSYDHTDDKSVYLYISYASEKSIKRNWRIEE